MNHYEITFLTRSEDSDGGVADVISQLGGEITNRLAPVRRKLAYPIKKEVAAVYFTYQFEIEATRINELNQKLNRLEAVLRHLVIADGIRKMAEAPARTTLKEKDLEVAESVTKGTAEFKAQAEAAALAETPAVAEAGADEAVAEEEPTKKSPAKGTKDVTAEELTSEERQKKLDEKLKSILGE